MISLTLSPTLSPTHPTQVPASTRHPALRFVSDAAADATHDIITDSIQVPANAILGTAADAMM